MPCLTSLFSSGESLWRSWVIHYCPLAVVQVSWLCLSNEVNTPLMWKLDTTMWWRQTGSSRVNCETRGPFDVSNARQQGRQRASGEVDWNARTCTYSVCAEVCTSPLCASVGRKERQRGGKKRIREESVFPCNRERVSEIGCVCARMKLILPSSQLTSFIQWMKWARKWQIFGK